MSSTAEWVLRVLAERALASSQCTPCVRLRRRIMFNTFLSTNAERQVNIDGATRLKAEGRLATSEQGVFAPALHCCLPSRLLARCRSNVLTPTRAPSCASPYLRLAPQLLPACRLTVLFVAACFVICSDSAGLSLACPAVRFYRGLSALLSLGCAFCSRPQGGDAQGPVRAVARHHLQNGTRTLALLDFPAGSTCRLPLRLRLAVRFCAC